MEKNFDVIVVGAGHAGIEAAYAAARMGSKTVLMTLSIDKIASMPCNPSIGGLGKSHIVFEIGAFGGLMPQLCTKTYLQAKMLNTSKGPAVQGLRLQIDKYEYSKQAQEILCKTPNLTIIQAMALDLIIDYDDQTKKKYVVGVQTSDGRIFYTNSIVITAGTFLNGIIHVGRTRYRAGRRGEDGVYGLSQVMAKAMDVSIGRLKTGTPPRLLKKTLDYNQFQQQPTESLPFLFEFNPVTTHERVPCYITWTNQKTHAIIQSNLHLSAMYSGNIKGIGPRYCPSIEDKVGRYPERIAHHVFIEPEGFNHEEIYPAGISTSLPYVVQEAYIRSIKGFENAVISKCGYAIEYDFIQPNNLTHTLESKTVNGLFLAGQINGTTGYEEAAGQGLIAGINAHCKHAAMSPLILNRSESYIGVMIDDLVTLGTDEPYRMFTSRAERRLLLRQDNAFSRLMPYAYKLGLITQSIYEQFLKEKTMIDLAVCLAKKPSIEYRQLFNLLHGIDLTQEKKDDIKQLLAPYFIQQGLSVDHLSSRAILSIHAEIKYDGYLQKEKAEADKSIRYNELIIPLLFSYNNIDGISKELQQKLSYYKPLSIAQAQLIPGITPAAISILIFHIRKNAIHINESI